MSKINSWSQKFAKMKQTKMRFGFTLAEVLITLGIIGVVAAITIPTLMQKYYEKQTVAKLKETYSILSQALKSASQEEGLPEEWENCNKESKESAEKGAAILKKYLKVAIDCGGDDSKGMCIAPEDYSFLNGNKAYSFHKKNYEYKMKLMNGSSIVFRFIDENDPARANEGMIMSFKIGTNGAAKPNTFGRDLFFMRYYEGKGLLLVGNPQIESPYTESCLNKMQDGQGCAYYVVTFGNMDYLKK